jgi:hypothetical protein
MFPKQATNRQDQNNIMQAPDVRVNLHTMFTVGFI